MKNNCGVILRVSHLGELSAKAAALEKTGLQIVARRLRLADVVIIELDYPLSSPCKPIVRYIRTVSQQLRSVSHDHGQCFVATPESR